MSQQKPFSAPDDDPQRNPPAAPHGDPWHAFGYLVSGVLVYGFVGWLLDRWWGTSFMVALGILVGAGLGIYMTFVRFNRTPSTTASPQGEGRDGQEKH